MAENSNSNNKKTTLNFTGLDMNVEKANVFNAKVNSIKAKIADSIQKNLNYENSIENKSAPASQLSPSMRILKDSGDYTVITLRCGAYPIFKNTTKKSEYTHTKILSSLKSMLKSSIIPIFLICSVAIITASILYEFLFVIILQPFVCFVKSFLFF